MKNEKTLKHKPRWLRKREILKVLGQYPGCTLTMRWLAFWLVGIGPSTHLLGMLHEMETERMIISKRTPYRKNATVLHWSITEIGLKVLAAIYDVERKADEIQI